MCGQALTVGKRPVALKQGKTKTFSLEIVWELAVADVMFHSLAKMGF